MKALRQGLAHGVRRVMIVQAVRSTPRSQRLLTSQRVHSAKSVALHDKKPLEKADSAGSGRESQSGSDSHNSQQWNRLLSVPVLCSLGGAAVALNDSAESGAPSQDSPPCADSTAASKDAATQTAPPAAVLADSTTKGLVATEDLYGGVNVDPKSLPHDPETFKMLVSRHLEEWKQQGKRGVWIKIPEALARHIPLAIDIGFKFHHAGDGFAMLSKWLPDSDSTLPHNASHYVGVGVAVIDEQGRILVVQEKSGPAAARGKDFWKVPTGLVNSGENMAEAAEREVLEETGIKVQFEGIVAIREQHKAGVEGKTDMFFMCKARPLSYDIVPCDKEIAAAKWMPAVEYANLPLWPEGSVYWLLTRLAVEHSLKGKGDLKGARLNDVPAFSPARLPRGFGTDQLQFVYSGAPRVMPSTHSSL